MPARTDHFSRVPGPAEARREVQFVVEDEPVAQASVPRHLDVRGEAKRAVLVDVAAANPHQHGMGERSCTFGVVSWNGMSAFISVPFLSSDGGMYS